MPSMSASALADERVRPTPTTARPYLVGGLAALSVGAAAIHFAVTFEHFSEYVLYGVFFLIISWAQMIWAVVVWRPSRLWLWLGIAGNTVVLAVYVASRSTGLPIGPDIHHPEPVGGLDVVSGILEFALIAGCAALLWRPSLADRPVRRRGAAATTAALLAVPVLVVAAPPAGAHRHGPPPPPPPPPAAPRVGGGAAGGRGGAARGGAGGGGAGGGG